MRVRANKYIRSRRCAGYISQCKRSRRPARNQTLFRSRHGLLGLDFGPRVQNPGTENAHMRAVRLESTSCGLESRQMGLRTLLIQKTSKTRRTPKIKLDIRIEKSKARRMVVVLVEREAVLALKTGFQKYNFLVCRCWELIFCEKVC